MRITGNHIKTPITALVIFALFAGIVLLMGLKPNHSPVDGANTVAFTTETLLEDLAVPWELLFMKDGSLLFTERPGRVRVYRDKQLLQRPLLEIRDIDTTKKMGLMGLVLHPSFESNHYLYIAYNYSSPSGSRLRVARYTMQRDTLTAEKTIIENIPSSQNHTGCRLKFGPDKKLYISTGDADQPAKAQLLTEYNGKILRVNDDGSVPSDNPFVNRADALKEIWSYGHRNPQGLAFHPHSGKLYISEHGPNGGDEINVVVKGGNYGWPVIHHQQTKDSMISPILEFTPSIGPAEVIFYNGSLFPELNGHLLVACLRGEAILDVQLNEDIVEKHQFLVQKQTGRIRALAVSADGNIYFSTSQKDPPEGKPSPGFDKILRLVSSDKKNINQPLEKIDPVSKEGTSKRASTANKTASNFQELCEGCHGKSLQGSQWSKPITKGKWKHGGTIKQVIASITNGYPQKGMPAWQGAISAQEIRNLAAYMIAITEKKAK